MCSTLAHLSVSLTKARIWPTYLHSCWPLSLAIPRDPYQDHSDPQCKPAKSMSPFPLRKEQPDWEYQRFFLLTKSSPTALCCESIRGISCWPSSPRTQDIITETCAWNTVQWESRLSAVHVLEQLLKTLNPTWIYSWAIGGPQYLYLDFSKLPFFQFTLELS